MTAKRPQAFPLLSVLLLLLLVVIWHPALAETINGRVVGVHDGDTLTLLLAGNQQLKIRLAQIDAPESNQGFGRVSKQSLSDLAFGKEVSVEVETIDKYGRTVGKVLVGGMDANLEQVKNGMAWEYVKYAHDPAYYSAKKSARANGVGLWSQPNPVPPWEFRHPERHDTKPVDSGQSMDGQASSGECGRKHFCKGNDQLRRGKVLSYPVRVGQA